MNVNLLPDLIESNLFSLYKGFAMAGNYTLTVHPSYSWIKTNKSIFPKNIFKIDPDMNDDVLSELVKMIQDDQVSPFLIFRDDKMTPAFIDRLKAKGFRQVMQWPGMAVPLQKNHTWITHDDFNIAVKKIKDNEEINEWADMVEQILFNGGKLDRKTLMALILSSDLNLYIGCVDGLSAGTLLSWTNDQVTGLYMITTLPAFRKKGVAWQLTNTAIRDAAIAGCRYAVLESTPRGLSLYRKAGFKEYCSFSIYWMLGKNTRNG
jgi:ribosomal protein S18 acetylase RimI-like enzyme